MSSEDSHSLCAIQTSRHETSQYFCSSPKWLLPLCSFAKFFWADPFREDHQTFISHQGQQRLIRTWLTRLSSGFLPSKVTVTTSLSLSPVYLSYSMAISVDKWRHCEVYLINSCFRETEFIFFWPGLRYQSLNRKAPTFASVLPTNMQNQKTGHMNVHGPLWTVLCPGCWIMKLNYEILVMDQLMTWSQRTWWKLPFEW
jgi:hypothetical protein